MIYSWKREMGEEVKECSQCCMPGLLELGSKRLCADCYSLKIWNCKLDHVPKKMVKKQLQKDEEYAGGKAYYEMLKMFRENKDE